MESMDKFDGFEKFAVKLKDLEAGFCYDFLGVKSRVGYHKSWKGLSGTQSKTPFGSNEWISLLHAVETAGDTASIIELGAGFGTWSVRGAVAARNIGKNYRMTAVEGETVHFQWLHEHCVDNDLELARCDLIEGIVASSPGVCLFPIADNPDIQWGLRPIFAPTEEIENIGQSKRFKLNDDGTYSQIKFPLRYSKSKVYDVAGILSDYDVADFIHFDIQGCELEAVEASIDSLSKKARIVYIGTHSADIEKGLRDVFTQANWNCLCDEPQKMRDNGYLGDGEQIWINPAFL